LAQQNIAGACVFEACTNDERVPIEKRKERSNELWRLPIVKRVSGLGRSSIYTRIRAGTFPLAIDLDGGPMRAWISSQVLDWVDQQIEASRKASKKRTLAEARALYWRWISPLWGG